MGEFIVSARKYRPATFASVVGQSAITTTLKNAVMQDQVAQAFLFCGPRGVGKTTCARILAKTINCTHRTPDGEACNECESCQSFNEAASFNIFELDAASNNSVEDIRNLTEQVRIPPQGAKYKVYIIDEVHMLSQAAFNAFLKTLEEPPAYAKFILATTEKHKILPTILSRCQVFDFKRIQLNDIVQHLIYVAQQENIQYEEEALRIIAQKADGGLRDALSIFDQETVFTSGNLTYQQIIENLNVLDMQYYIRMTELLYRGDIAQALLTYNEIMEKGFDGQHFLDGICKHLRDLMVCRSPQSIRLLDVGEQLRNSYLTQVQQIDVNFLLQCLDIFNRCSGSYKTSNNKRLHVEVAMMMICRGREGKPESLQPTTTTAPSSTAKTTISATPPTVSKPQTAATTNIGPAKTDMPQNTSPNPTTTTPASNPSFRDLMDDLKTIPTHQEEEKKKSEPDPITSQEDKTDAMDPATAAHYCLVNWEELIHQYGGKNLAAISLLTDKEKITIEDHVITFTVSNNVAEKSIREILKTLTEGLWEKTGIRYEAEFVMEKGGQTPARLINPDEKFQKMSEINPELLRLKKELNLSIN